LGLGAPREDVKLTHVPGELFAGACMNRGHQLASGEYCFRVDDDDFYAPNYILDMMLNLRAVDADLFGKPMSIYYHFSDLHALYKDDRVQGMRVLTPANLAKGQRFSGNSISGRRELFVRSPYSEFAHSAADSVFLLEADLEGCVIACF